MARRPPRILGWRLAIVGVVAGVVFAVLSVPAAALVRPWAIDRPWLAQPDAYWIEGEQDIAITVLDASTPGYQSWYLMNSWEGRASEFPASARTGPGAHLRADPRPVKIRGEGDGITNVDEFVVAGWPWPCACGRGVSGSDAGWTRSDGGLLRARSWGWSRPIPLRPLWDGLLANTAFYAALMLGFVVLLRLFRRHHRRSRNRCLRCGYDIANSPGVCPECGTPDPRATNLHA